MILSRTSFSATPEHFHKKRIQLSRPVALLVPDRISQLRVRFNSDSHPLPLAEFNSIRFLPSPPELVSVNPILIAILLRYSKWPRKVCLDPYLYLSRSTMAKTIVQLPIWRVTSNLSTNRYDWLILRIAKSRTIAVRLISMAMTGYYRTMIRPRTHRPLSMLKYDPVVKKKVLFLEATKRGKAKWTTLLVLSRAIFLRWIMVFVLIEGLGRDIIP